MERRAISLMSGFRDIGKDGRTKGSIRVQADELLFNPDDRLAAQAFADAMVDVIKEHLMQGLAPDGQPLPALKASTHARREIEAAQGQRGGDAAPRFNDAAFRRAVAKRYRKDYAPPGGSSAEFTPDAKHPRGEVSGLLIESMVARGDKNGRGVTVYVAAKRGRPRESTTARAPETKSALESVLAGAPLVTQRMTELPQMKKSLAMLAQSLIGKPSEIRKAMKELKRAATEALETLNDLPDEIDPNK